MTSRSTELEPSILSAGPPLKETWMTPAALGRAPNTMKRVAKASCRIERRILSIISPRELILHPQRDLCKENQENQVLIPEPLDPWVASPLGLLDRKSTRLNSSH